MARLPITPNSRVTHDPHTHAIRTWFDVTAPPADKATVSPHDVAYHVLRDSADLFAWQGTLPDLRDSQVIAGENSFSVRFRQVFKALPVDSSEIVVDLYADRRVYSVYNAYHYDIPRDLDPGSARLNAAQVKEAIAQLMASYGHAQIGDPELIVYQYHPVALPRPAPSTQPARVAFLAQVEEVTSVGASRGVQQPQEGQYFLAWDTTVRTQRPTHLWRILIDAVTGQLLNVIDLLQYATGTGEVFDPNPIVTSGDATLRHTSLVATVDGQRLSVPFSDLDPADGGGNLHLHGPYVHMAEEDSPTIAEPGNAAGDFNYSWQEEGFLDAMAYFHIDRFQAYIQSVLGMTNVANYSIPVDPQGYGGADNSFYTPGGGTGYIRFGGGIVPPPSTNPVPDAADAMVVLHEYGHAIQDNVNPGFTDFYTTSGLGEGFGDFLAAVYYDDKHANPPATRGYMMSWDSEMGTGSWSGRRYDMEYGFDDPTYLGYTDSHDTGQLWCATLFELYRKLGGDSAYAGIKQYARDLAIRLHLAANFNVPQTSATVQQMGQQIEAADHNLGGWRYANGLHRKVIYDTFRRRHLPGYTDLPVDVYIDDGRAGGYGSLSGNDHFAETLWQDVFWETQEIWTRPAPYVSAAAQAAATPADHIEPVVGSTAYLYVRVKNRGTASAGSGPVTVKAFHCAPGMGLTWPDDWTPMDPPTGADVSNVLPGTSAGVVVGPFSWTPTEVGHECALAIVECGQDRALTQDLASSDHVADGDLVPFDNNIAQRNLAPTMSKDKTVRAFYVQNPSADMRTVQLHYTERLPQGWRWRVNLANPTELLLGPHERRRVEVMIDQAGGREVTPSDDTRYSVTITGVVEGRVIGGMTFYIAPPSTFPAGAATLPSPSRTSTTSVLAGCLPVLMLVLGLLLGVGLTLLISWLLTRP